MYIFFFFHTTYNYTSKRIIQLNLQFFKNQQATPRKAEKAKQEQARLEAQEAEKMQQVGGAS